MDAFNLSTASKIKVLDPVTGKKRKGIVFGTVNQVDGVTATFTKVIWGKNNNKWIVVQHFPFVKSWNNITKTYTDSTLIVIFIFIF